MLLALLLILVGCDSANSVRKLPRPEIEYPPANLPASLHQENWASKQRDTLGQGSCVHASSTNMFRWHNMFEFGEEWRAENHGGEYDSRLMRKLDAKGIKYVYTQKADPRFLDWVSETRRAAPLWFKPSHCCLFLGWCEKDGRQYAAILDPNRPGKIELTPREQFVRLWAGYGGFAYTILNPPAPQLTWPSYEVL